MSLTESELRSLWKNDKFPGSYQSAIHFQQNINHEFGVKIPLNKIYEALSKIEEFQQSVRSIKKFPRRKYTNVRSFFKLVQTDLALMPNWKGFKYFIVVVDVFSRRLWALKLKRKTPSEIVKSLEKIFSSVGSYPEKLNSDRGLEYISKQTTDYFKEKNIFFRPRHGPLKANFAEFAIARVKKILYVEMRAKKTKNWVSLLQGVIDKINNTPMKVLNNLKPSDFNSKFDDVKIRTKANNWKMLLRNQKDYEKNKNNIQVGDIVYLDKYILGKHNAFPKSYEVQVSKLAQT